MRNVGGLAVNILKKFFHFLHNFYFFEAQKSTTYIGKRVFLDGAWKTRIIKILIKIFFLTPGRFSSINLIKPEKFPEHAQFLIRPR